MMNKVLLAFLAICILATSPIAASAGTETQLTKDELLTLGTSFYGNHVYWTETAGNQVHAYDLTTGKRTNIEGHAAGSQINSYGNKVVWTGDDGVAVYMYDISTGNETKISPDGVFPDIYGNYIVYTKNYNQDHKNGGIYLYDLNTGDKTKIASVYGYPAIYDKTVVWSQANCNNGYDICKYDISAKKTSIITTTNSSIPEFGLDIYGNKVVWTESNKLYMYDMVSHKKTQITNCGNAYKPAIYDKRIVYVYGSNASVNGDIYVYDISTTMTKRITTSNNAFSPSIYGDKIVYADIRNLETPDVRDIYLYDLSNASNKIVANFSSNITSGISPLTVSFTDISKGTPNAWCWNFGDGTISTLQNPMHTYESPGNYVVKLTASNANGTSFKTVTINVLKSCSGEDSDSSEGSCYSNSRSCGCSCSP